MNYAIGYWVYCYHIVVVGATIWLAETISPRTPEVTLTDPRSTEQIAADVLESDRPELHTHSTTISGDTPEDQGRVMQVPH